MDLGLEAIVAKPVESVKIDASYIDSFITYQNSCEEFGEFLDYGKQLLTAFENVSDVCNVIKKYGVTESLISLVGSNFVSQEDNSPSVTEAEPDSGDEGGSGLNEAKKEEAAKVGSGADSAKKSLWQKLVAWFKNLLQKFINWFNSHTVMFGKADKALSDLKDPNKEFTYKGVDGKEKTVAAGKFGAERDALKKDLLEAHNMVKKAKQDLEAKKKDFDDNKKNLSDDEIALKKEAIVKLNKELGDCYKLGRQQIAVCSSFCAAASKAGKGGEAKPEEPAKEGEEKK